MSTRKRTAAHLMIASFLLVMALALFLVAETTSAFMIRNVVPSTTLSVTRSAMETRCATATHHNGANVRDDGADCFVAAAVKRRRTRSQSSRSTLRMSLRKTPSPKNRTEPATEKSPKDVVDLLEKNIANFDPFNFEGTRKGGDLSTSTTFDEKKTRTTDEIGNDHSEEEEENNGVIGIWAARGLLLIVAVLWATNFATVKYLETLCFHPPCNHPPSEAALARFGVAALVSLPLLVNQRKDIIFAGLECGLWITLGYITQALALQTVPSGECAFICSLTVVVVPLISSLVFGKEFKPINAISAALALVGVGVLEGLVDFNSILGIQPAVADATTALASTAAPEVSSAAAVASSSAITASASAAAETTGWLASIASTLGMTKGDLLALGQPIGFGLAFMRIEFYVEKFKDVKNRIVTMSAAQCVAVGLMSLLWVLIDFNGHIPNFEYMIEPHRLGAIAWTGIMTTVVAIYLEGVALQTASATEAAITFSSEPVWAALFGAWLLHERLGLNAYVGGTIILMACLVSAVADLRGEQAKKEHEKIDEIIETQERMDADKIIAND